MIVLNSPTYDSSIIPQPLLTSCYLFIYLCSSSFSLLLLCTCIFSHPTPLSLSLTHTRMCSLFQALLPEQETARAGTTGQKSYKGLKYRRLQGLECIYGGYDGHAYLRKM